MEQIRVGDVLFTLKDHYISQTEKTQTLNMTLSGTTFEQVAASFVDGAVITQITGDGLEIDRSEFDTMKGITFRGNGVFDVAMEIGDERDSLRLKVDKLTAINKTLEYNNAELERGFSEFSAAMQAVIEA